MAVIHYTYYYDHKSKFKLYQILSFKLNGCVLTHSNLARSEQAKHFTFVIKDMALIYYFYGFHRPKFHFFPINYRGRHFISLNIVLQVRCVHMLVQRWYISSKATDFMWKLWNLKWVYHCLHFFLCTSVTAGNVCNYSWVTFFMLYIM